MRILHSGVFAALVSVVIWAAGTAWPQPADVEAQRGLVVKVRIHRPGQSDETAAGLFVGKDAQNAYFISALHAVAIDPEKDEVVLSPSIQLQFRGSPQTYSAVGVQYNGSLDLVVVRTAARNLPSHLPKMAWKEVVVGEQVRIIGHPAGGAWSVWPTGAVENENAPGNIQRFTTTRDQALAGGYSGGPVLDARGTFLGMHLSTETSYGIAAKGSDIIKQLQAWQIPVDNLTRQPAAADSTPPAAGPTDKEAINRVVDSYTTAYNQKNADALWKVWPNPPDSARRGIAASFSSARTIVVRVTDRSIDVNGSRATVTGQYSQEYTPKNGSLQRTSGEISIGLEKQGNSWIISSVK